jgi:hypothetical protein
MYCGAKAAVSFPFPLLEGSVLTLSVSPLLDHPLCQNRRARIAIGEQYSEKTRTCLSQSSYRR